jgi:hypothetical protein
MNVTDARDNLILAKITQSIHANTARSKAIPYKIGNKVMLSTLNRRHDYKTTDKQRVTKFMPCFDGPYLVTNSFPETSTVTLDIPHAPNIFPTFHTSHIKPFIPNDNLKFPSRLWSDLDQSTSNPTVVLNTAWTKSLTTKRQAMETSSTWSNGLITDPKTTFGFQVTNYKITEPSTTT